MKQVSIYASGAIISAVAIGSVISFQNQVFAQSSNCPATPKIGYRCYQERKLYARTGYGESPSTDQFSFSPPPGYRLIDYQENVQSRFGSGGGLNVDFVREGTVAQIRQEVTSANRTLIDRQSKARSYAKWSIQVGGETETIEKALGENNSRLAILDNSNSNIDRVVASVTVSGRCTRVVLGTCADNEGGKYEGTVKFQLEYVGTPADIHAANAATIARIDAALQRFEQARQAEESRRAAQARSDENRRRTAEQTSCINIDSRTGWQTFTFTHPVHNMQVMSGQWKISASGSSLGAKGYGPNAGEFGTDFFDRNFPLGALLVSFQGSGVSAFQSDFFGSGGLIPGNTAIQLRINESDDHLADNEGSLRICLDPSFG